MAEAQVIQKFYADWGDYVRQYEEREEKQKLFDEQIRALRRQIYWMRDPYSLDEFDREFSAITSVLDERADLPQTEKFKVAVDRMRLVVEMLKSGSARSVNSEYH
jgi:hypothetical protein